MYLKISILHRIRMLEKYMDLFSFGFSNSPLSHSLHNLISVGKTEVMSCVVFCFDHSNCKRILGSVFWTFGERPGIVEHFIYHFYSNFMHSNDLQTGFYVSLCIKFIKLEYFYFIKVIHEYIYQMKVISRLYVQH